MSKLPCIFFTESSKNLGGQELQILQQIKELDRYGYEAILVCKKNSQIYKSAISKKISVVTFPFLNAIDLLTIFGIILLAIRHRPKAIFCHSGHDAIISGFVKYALRFFFVKVTLIRMRTYQHGIPNYFPYEHLFDVTFTPSYYLRSLILKQPKISPDKIHVLYPGVDFSSLDRDLAKVDLPKSLTDWLDKHPGPIISHCAILRSEKNHLFMLDVIARLIRKLPSVRYIIAGDGPLQNIIKQRIYDLGLTENVFMAGMLPSIARLIGQSSIAVMPSKYEPLGMFQIEAQYLGVPVVVSAVGGIPETVIDNETGFVLPINDINIWVDKLFELLSDGVILERMGLSARISVREKFCKDANTQKLIKLIQQGYSQTNFPDSRMP